MDYDYNRPSDQIVFDLIFYATGTALDKDAIVFGIPKGFTPHPGDSLKRDTRLGISLLRNPDSRMRGTVEVTYCRLKLEDFIPEFEDAPIEVISLPFTAYQVLPQINARYGLSLAESDIEDAVFTEASATYAIKARPESLAWTGTLAIETTYEEIDLGLLIKVTELNGLWPIGWNDDLEDIIEATDLNGFEAA